MSQKNIDYYYYNSLAYRRKNYNSKDKANKSKSNALNKKIYKANLSLLEFLFLIIIIFIGSIISLRTFCLVKAKSNEIIILQEKLKAIKSENKILEEEISKKFDLSTVKDVAEKKLGMHEPFGYQVVKIKLPKLDYVIKYKR